MTYAWWWRWWWLLTESAPIGGKAVPVAAVAHATAIGCRRQRNSEHRWWRRWRSRQWRRRQRRCGGSGIVIIRYASAAVSNQISGKVFRDYNADGALGSGEPGVSGITVAAYDSSNAIAASTTTDSSGNYTLTGLTDTQPYRIEFTNVPSYLKPGPIGPDTASTVVFVTSPASDVDLGLQNPAEYAGPDSGSPQLTTTIAFAGDPSGSVSGQPSLVSVPYDAAATSGLESTLAEIQDLGSTWGLAYQRSTHTVFVAAALKRGSGFGPLGSGGIYAIDITDPNNPQQGTVTQWLNLNGFVTAGSSTIDTGSVDRTGSNALPTNAEDASEDIDAYQKVGKMSLGDIDFDENDSTLWVINLNDQSLYGIQNVDPNNAPTSGGSDVIGPFAITQASTGITCTNGLLRPWGVKAHDGKVYVSAVCSGESNSSATRTDLSGHVLEFDPSNTGAGFTEVLTIDLGDSSYGHPMTDEGTSGSGWQTWYFADHLVTQADMTNYPPAKARWAVPILTDIEFAADGSMIIGIKSRFGGMQGQHEHPPNPGTSNLIDEVVAAGDTLRACLVSGAYVLEGSPGCPASQANGQGPGGTEFYYQDNGPANDTLWYEQTIGALALLPGRGEVVTTAFDPTDYYENGFEWYSNTAGSQNKNYQVYADPNLPSLGKGNGLGDIELLVPPAPIEIGNRVWIDANQNGIQDPGEDGIPDVQVALYESTSTTPLATATTDSNGNYLFSSASTGSASGAVYGVNIDPTGTYKLVVLNSNYDTGQPLETYLATIANADSPPRTDNDAVTDNHDSDGVPVTVGAGDPIGVTFTNQGTGADNHSFDFGFYYQPTVATIGEVSLKPTSVGDFLAGLDVSNMSVGALSALLQKWNPEAAVSLGTAASQQQLVDALTTYLDPDGNGVVAVFRWETLEENGTIGFYVERHEGSANWVRINNDLLPGLIDAPMGAEYQLADPGAVSGQVYQYRLIEQEAAGTTRTYGPFSVEMP